MKGRCRLFSVTLTKHLKCAESHAFTAPLNVLGPLLFLVYVSDIADQLLSLTRLFADDSSLFFLMF